MYIPLWRNEEWLAEYKDFIIKKYEIEGLYKCEIAKLLGISDDMMLTIFDVLGLKKSFQKKEREIRICANKNCVKGVNGKRKEFEVYIDSNQKFCSYTCCGEAKRGKKNTKEHNRNISKALKGRILSEEWIKNLSKGQIKRFEDSKEHEKLSIAHLGQVPYNKGMQGLDLTKANYHLSIAKTIDSNRGKKRSPEACKKNSEGHRGEKNGNYGKPRTKETRKKIGDANRKPETIAKGRITREKNNTMSNSPIIIAKSLGTKTKNGTLPGSPIITAKMLATKEKNGTTSRILWGTLKYQKAYAKGVNAKPTNLEQFFNGITPNNIKYVGDRKLWIRTKKGNRNPDFIIEGQKKIIETFGDFWHKGENPKSKIKEYAEVGWECIVFWENEVYNKTEQVLEKTLEFIEDKEV